MKTMKPFYIAVLMGAAAFTPAAAATSPVVLELYTSQNCPSCPPADALLQTLAADPRVLALSFHVDYFDAPDAKDPFSLADSTARQTLYGHILKQEQLYTPEVVIDGQHATLGSYKSDITTYIDVLSGRPKPLGVSIAPDADKQNLTISFTGKKPGDVQTAGVWMITFSPKPASAVRGGDALNRAMNSINNVTAIQRVGVLTETNPPPLTAKMAGNPGYGYAVLVQEPSGRVIGAGSYLP